MDGGVLTKSLAYFLLSFSLSFLLAPVVIWFLYRYNVRRGAKRHPSVKDIHSKKIGTPKMGGLVFVITIPLITYFFNWVREWTWVPIGVMLLMAVAGGIDDVLDVFGRERPVQRIRDVLGSLTSKSNFLTKIYKVILLPWNLYKALFYELGSVPGKSLQAHERMLIHVAGGAIVAWWYYVKLAFPTRGLLWLPFGLSQNIGWVMVPLIIIAVVGLANAVNITDGADGLAAGTLIPAFAAFGLIAFQMKIYPITILCATVAGGIMAFLYFNIKPARFFMGDVGSISLGALLAIIAVLLNREILLLVIGGVYVWEVLSDVIQIASRTFVEKGILKERVFKMAPFHHHLEMIGWPEEKIVMRAWVLSLFFSALGVFLAQL